MYLWISHFYFHLHLHLALLQGWLFTIFQDHILRHSSNSIFLIWGNMNTKWERMMKKSVSHEGNFLKMAVSYPSIRALIFLKLWGTSFEKNLMKWVRKFSSGWINIDTLRSWAWEKTSLEKVFSALKELKTLYIGLLKVRE